MDCYLDGVCVFELTLFQWNMCASSWLPRWDGNAWPIRQWDQDFFFVGASIDEHFYKISKLDNWISRVFHSAPCSPIRPASVWLDHVHHSLVICIFSTFDIFCVLCIAEFFQLRFHVRARVRVHISRPIRVQNEWRAIRPTSAMCDPHSPIFAWGLTTFHLNFLFARMRTVAFARPVNRMLGNKLYALSLWYVWL